MNLPAAESLAGRGRLYPSVILHGGRAQDRQAAVVQLAQILLCDGEAALRPCLECSHCRRIAWPESEDVFHPDFHLLERDLKTVTSTEATKEFIRKTHFAPFESRGQVFVIAAAETLSGGAANALLKSLEEPSLASPRNFFLLAPSQFDLLPTLRSRSFKIYLGSPAAGLDPEDVAQLSAAFKSSVTAYLDQNSPVFLLTASDSLETSGNWKDPRNQQPWQQAAAAVLHTARDDEVPSGMRRNLLALAEALLTAGEMRLRGIPARRILDGLVAKHLTAVG